MVHTAIYKRKYSRLFAHTRYTCITGISDEETRIIPRTETTVRAELTDGNTGKAICTGRYIISGGEIVNDEEPKVLSSSLAGSDSDLQMAPR